MPKPRSKRKGNPDTNNNGYPGPIKKGKGRPTQLDYEQRGLEMAAAALRKAQDDGDADGDDLEKLEAEVAIARRAVIDAARATRTKPSAPLTTAQRKALMAALPDDIDPDELTEAEKRALINK
jgi:hypothetical protein